MPVYLQAVSGTKLRQASFPSGLTSIRIHSCFCLRNLWDLMGTYGCSHLVPSSLMLMDGFNTATRSILMINHHGCAPMISQTTLNQVIAWLGASRMCLSFCALQLKDSTRSLSRLSLEIMCTLA